MVIAYVHGVLSRAPAVAVTPACALVHVFPDYGRVVVVVAHYRVHRGGVADVLQQSEAVRFVESALAPVYVVRCVAHVEGVDGAGQGGRFTPYDRHHIGAEAPDVVALGVVGQVHVRQEDDAVAPLALLFEHEVVHLVLLRRQVQLLPEPRTQAVQAAGDVSGRGDDEDAAVRLVGVYAVAAVVVRQHYGDAVGYGYPLDGSIAADDAAVDVPGQRADAACRQQYRQYGPFHFTADLGLPAMQTRVETRPPMGHHQVQAM